MGTGWLRFERTPLPTPQYPERRDRTNSKGGPRHGALASLGCGSCLSYPAVYDARCVGAVNLCHEEKYYTAERSRLGLWLAPLMLPAILGP